MKKFFILFISVLALISCHTKYKYIEVNELPTNTVMINGEVNYHYEIIEMTVNTEYGPETHEYVKYLSAGGWFGLAHWEGCKYCKESHKD